MSESGSTLLARNAEDLLWLARYMERVENVSRILEVTQTYAHEDTEGSHWRAVLAINSDEQRFFESHAAAGARSVTRFYLLDRDNPSSIQAAMHFARENARTLRALISNEMWAQLNVFHAWIRELNEDDIAPEQLWRVCAALKEGCQTHTGITEGTLYRDQGRVFYALGRYLERADQTTRLLDIGFRALRSRLASQAQIAHEQWLVLLREAAGYHAYRRLHPAGFSPAEVVVFLLADEAFPRSVRLSLRQVCRHLTDLRDRHGLAAASRPLAHATRLHDALDGRDAVARLETLPAFLDQIQQRIGALHGDIERAFFPERAD